MRFVTMPLVGRIRTAHVEGARRQAASIEPELSRALIEREAQGGGGEAIAIKMFPPTYRVGGFSFTVRRAPSGEHAQGAGAWSTRAESLHARYHAMFLRSAPGGEASLIFDGWDPGAVAAIAPLFQAAADRCLEDQNR